MTGLGAWSFGYYQQGMDVTSDRVAAGVQAFKHALIDNGYGTGINLDARGFGHSMTKQAKAFQRAHGLIVDGIIGPTTARYLFRQYSFPAEASGTIEMPDHLCQRLGGAESGHDPVAQGYADPDDEGWAQINGPSHPKITLAQRWSPAFAAPWAASYLKTFYVNERADWDGAVASYNVGQFYAVEWVDAGKPSSGKFVNGVDVYARAHNYVNAVRSQPT